jgi:hypothetical protein
MKHLSLSPSEYAYEVYELLAAHQVAQDLSYDGDRTISAAGVQAESHYQGTEITFPDPYTDEPVTIVVVPAQPPTAAAATIEALLTRYAFHFAFVAAEAAQARLRSEVQ